MNGANYTFDSLTNLVTLNSGSSADFTFEELGIKYSYRVDLRSTGEGLRGISYWPQIIGYLCGASVLTLLVWLEHEGSNAFLACICFDIQRQVRVKELESDVFADSLL